MIFLSGTLRALASTALKIKKTPTSHRCIPSAFRALPPQYRPLSHEASTPRRSLAATEDMVNPNDSTKSRDHSARPLPEVRRTQELEPKGESRAADSQLEVSDTELLTISQEAIGYAGSISDEALLDMPPPPQAPSYPCPYLTDTQIVVYLEPLYQRGWFVDSSERERKHDAPPSNNVAPELCKTFSFHLDGVRDAAAFMAEVNKIQEVEQHHCAIIKTRTDVTIRVHTHSARPLPRPTDTKKPSKRPGITLRDVRLAIALEHAFHRYLEGGAGLLCSQEPSSHSGLAQPRSAEEIERMRFA